MGEIASMVLGWLEFQFLAKKFRMVNTSQTNMAEAYETVVSVFDTRSTT